MTWTSYSYDTLLGAVRRCDRSRVAKRVTRTRTDRHTMRLKPACTQKILFDDTILEKRYHLIYRTVLLFSLRSPEPHIAAT